MANAKLDNAVTNGEAKKGLARSVKMILINIALSGIAVYVFQFWFHQLNTLSMTKQIMNIGIIALTGATYFVSKTYYTKGVLNNIKKIIYVVGLALATLTLVYYTVETPTEIVYPLSGVILISIAFYMVSLSAGTLGLLGMIGMAILATMLIGAGKKFDYIAWDTAIELGKLSVFLILFLGGTWAELRAFVHGIRGINKDGGGFGSGNNGDPADGDDDTGAEE